MFGVGRKNKPALADGRVLPGDADFMSGVAAAQVVERVPQLTWPLWLMALAVGAALAWAMLARVEVVTRADGRVVPDGREQAIASLEGGILRELLVREGMLVDEGQAVARLDPTRFEAQQNEGQSRRLALKAAIARLGAEAGGRHLVFPDEVRAAPDLMAAETEVYSNRRQVLQEAVAVNNRNVGLLQRELDMAELMSAKGLLSDVEVMRLRRQVNDLRLASSDRLARFRQDASADLLKAQNELAAMEEQQVVREDALRRTVLRSPVKGLVKSIKLNTLGGVVGPGAVIMEIVPLGPRVLVEARVKPQDVGFIRVGQTAQVKLTAYEYVVYGAMTGTVEYISPDALGDADRAAQNGTWYRVILRADPAALRAPTPLQVLPGMLGTVEINTAERSVLSFLLRPMMKSQEAFKER
jgi:adhesin transport system membrane fusion protein